MILQGVKAACLYASFDNLEGCIWSLYWCSECKEAFFQVAFHRGAGFSKASHSNWHPRVKLVRSSAEKLLSLDVEEIDAGKATWQQVRSCIIRSGDTLRYSQDGPVKASNCS